MTQVDCASQNKEMASRYICLGWLAADSTPPRSGNEIIKTRGLFLSAPSKAKKDELVEVMSGAVRRMQ